MYFSRHQHCTPISPKKRKKAMEEKTMNTGSMDLSNPSTRTSSLYNAYIVTTVMKNVMGVDSINSRHFFFLMEIGFVFLVSSAKDTCFVVPSMSKSPGNCFSGMVDGLD